jgi:hypothetical protein
VVSVSSVALSVVSVSSVADCLSSVSSVVGFCVFGGSGTRFAFAMRTVRHREIEQTPVRDRPTEVFPNHIVRPFVEHSIKLVMEGVS